MCPPPPKPLKRFKGFTLAELLIALAILGVIATFTIPKILNSQSNGQNNAIGHEVAGMVGAAYQQHMLNGYLSSSTKSSDYTQYMNYVAVDSTTTIDDVQGNGTVSCSSAQFMCLKLHNGAMLLIRPTETYGGTTTTNAILFLLDPDGQANGVKASNFMLTYPGKVTTVGTCSVAMVSSGFSYPCSSSYNPSWFNW